MLAQISFTFALYSLVSLYKTGEGNRIAELGIVRLRREHARSYEGVVVYLDDCYAISTVQEFMALVLENLDAFRTEQTAAPRYLTRKRLKSKPLLGQRALDFAKSLC